MRELFCNRGTNGCLVERNELAIADTFTAFVYDEYNTFDGCLILAACYGVKKEGTDDLIGPFFVLHCLLDYWA